MGRLDDIAKRNREALGHQGGPPATPPLVAPPEPPRFQLPSQQRTSISPKVVIPTMIFIALGIGAWVWLRMSRAEQRQQQHELRQ